MHLRIMLLLVITSLFVGCRCEVENYEKQTSTTKSEEIVKELLNVSADEKLVAIINTNVGTFEIELFTNKVTKTVENFVGLAKNGKYENVIFHRVIPQFMIQGGDPTGTGRGGESYWGGKFEDEFDMTLRHDKPGILSMANAGANTNGSQFFITLVPTPWLDGKHSVFGEVISGMDIVNGIGETETGMMDKPVNDIIMQKVEIEKRPK